MPLISYDQVVDVWILNNTPLNIGDLVFGRCENNADVQTRIWMVNHINTSGWHLGSTGPFLSNRMDLERLELTALYNQEACFYEAGGGWTEPYFLDREEQFTIFLDNRLPSTAGASTFELLKVDLMGITFNLDARVRQENRMIFDAALVYALNRSES